MPLPGNPARGGDANGPDSPSTAAGRTERPSPCAFTNSTRRPERAAECAISDAAVVVPSPRLAETTPSTRRSRAEWITRHTRRKDWYRSEGVCCEVVSELSPASPLRRLRRRPRRVITPKHSSPNASSIWRAVRIDRSRTSNRTAMAAPTPMPTTTAPNRMAMLRGPSGLTGGSAAEITETLGPSPCSLSFSMGARDDAESVLLTIREAVRAISLATSAAMCGSEAVKLTLTAWLVPIRATESFFPNNAMARSIATRSASGAGAGVLPNKRSASRPNGGTEANSGSLPRSSAPITRVSTLRDRKIWTIFSTRGMSAGPGETTGSGPEWSSLL